MKRIKIILALGLSCLSLKALAGSENFNEGVPVYSRDLSGYTLEDFTSGETYFKNLGLKIYQDLSNVKDWKSIAEDVGLVGDLQYACSEIIIRTVVTVSVHTNFVFGDALLSNGRVDAVCIQRSLYEKQLISLSRRCQSVPDEVACGSMELLEKIKEVKATMVTYDNSGIDLSPLKNR